MSSLAAYPWQEITFFAHGHTVPFGAIGGFDAILFVNPKMVLELEQPEYTEVPTDVNLLWLILQMLKSFTQSLLAVDSN